MELRLYACFPLLLISLFFVLWRSVGRILRLIIASKHR
jgi:hypothetical protein